MAAITFTIGWLASSDLLVAFAITCFTSLSQIRVIRLFLFTKLTISEHSVVIQNSWRRHVLAWEEINAFVVDGNAVTMTIGPQYQYTYACLAVRRRTGDVIPIDGLRANSSSAKEQLTGQMRQLNALRKQKRKEFLSRQG